MRREPSAHEVAVLLRAWSDENKEGLDRVAPVVCRAPPVIAKCLMACDRLSHVLQVTALFGEACLRLVDVHQISRPERPPSLGICARTIRQFLVDYSRFLVSMKRGAGKLSLGIKEGLATEPSPNANFLEVDGALGLLAKINPDEAK